MLSYQHAYHAGNRADCLKHTLWGEILAAMVQKPTPLWVGETHAGRGLYPLGMPEMQKLAEYRTGVADMWHLQREASTAYMAAVRALNMGGRLEVVPGSPWVASGVLRPGDALHLCEKHPLEETFLRKAMGRLPGVHIHKADGPAHMAVLLKGGTRAAVLIDPSYELKDEYRKTVDHVATLLKRVPAATVMVWAPLLPDERHKPVVEGLTALEINATWQAAYQWEEEESQGLMGTLQVVLNLPYALEVTLPDVLTRTVSVWEGKAAAEKLTTGFLVPRR